MKLAISSPASHATEVDDLDQGDAGRVSFGLFYPSVPWRWAILEMSRPCAVLLGVVFYVKKNVVKTVDSCGDG